MKSSNRLVSNILRFSSIILNSVVRQSHLLTTRLTHRFRDVPTSCPVISLQILIVGIVSTFYRGMVRRTLARGPLTGPLLADHSTTYPISACMNWSITYSGVLQCGFLHK